MNLPNPFLSSAVEPSAEESTVASPVPSRSDDAAADHYSVSPGALTSSLPSGESDPSVMLDLAPGESRFVLDELAFFEAIEPVPLFLRPVIELLAGY